VVIGQVASPTGMTPGPLKIWGPSGETPGKITVEEFGYKAVNAVVYNEIDATIRSIPVIHAGDGAVSYILEYAGLNRSQEAAAALPGRLPG